MTTGRRALLLTLAAWLMLPTAGRAAGTPKLNVAVLDFEGRNVSASDAVAIAGFVRSAVIRTSKYVVVDKGNMDKILAEQAFQQTGCTSSECAVKLGKLLNVQKMIVGEYTVVEGTRYMTASLVDVQTGAMEATAKVRGFDGATLDDAADRLVAQLAKTRVAAAEETGSDPMDRRFALFASLGYAAMATASSGPGTMWTVNGSSDRMMPAEIAKPDPVSVPFGIRFFPAKWLRLEGFYSPIGVAGAVIKLGLNGTGSTATDLHMRSSAVGAGAAYALPVGRRLRVLTGLGVWSVTWKQVDKSSSVSWMTGGLAMQLNKELNPITDLYLDGRLEAEWFFTNGFSVGLNLLYLLAGPKDVEVSYSGGGSLMGSFKAMSFDPSGLTPTVTIGAYF